MRKNFTIFQPGFDNDVFNKDVGLIPIIFQKHLGYSCNFLCYSVDGDYDKLTENKIKITFIDNDETIKISLKNTDVLMLFGIYDYNLEMIERYREINPRGKIYLKLDMNIHWLKRIEMNEQLIRALNKCTLISVECRTLEKYIKEHWPVKVRYIPNGYYSFSDETVDYKVKDNIIITVGRLGTYQKATEVLLEGFKIASEKVSSWKLRLIGNIEESFKSYIDKFFNDNPYLKDKIEFTGKIVDRKQLEKEYEKAKIFCLTSRFEGFPNVFPEGAVKGCYIISSDIDPAYDITSNKKHGSIFSIDDAEELAKELINVCSNEDFLEKSSYDIQNYVKRNFNWISLCRRIDYYINMPEGFKEAMPYILQRVVMESPLSILDLCRYPSICELLSEEVLGESQNKLTIDRIEIEPNNRTSLYEDMYDNWYKEEFLDVIDKLPKYDVILLSQVLEYLSKDDGFMMIDILLQHINKKLIITIPKDKSDIFRSRYSYIDFHKYNFSCSTERINEDEVFILSVYPNYNKISNIDMMLKDYKTSNTAHSGKNKKLNIAYILPHRSVTGGLKVLIKQMRLLKERGHTVTGILQGDYTGSIFPDTDKIKIDKEVIIGWNDKIDDQVKGFDVIVAGFINEWVRIEDKNLPVVLFEQGYETLFGESKVKDPYVEKNIKSYFDNVYRLRQNVILTVSSVLAEILYYRYGRVCRVIPNGIDTSLYYPLSKEENKSENCGTKILLIGSPYLDFKGFDLALKVLQRLAGLLIKLEITWICQEKPNYYIPLNINYVVNPREEVLAEVIRENHILLSASWYESFALPPLEAMASGVAVVATDSGGIRTYGRDGYNCILVEPGDTNKLLMSLMSLIFNEGKRNELISNGLKTASEFNNENMINLLETTLYDIADFYKNNFIK